MKYRSSSSACDDLRLEADPLSDLNDTGNGTMANIFKDGTIGWMFADVSLYYMGPAPDEAFGFYFIPQDQSWVGVFLQKGNVLVFVQGIGMELKSLIDIAEMQCDQVHFVGAKPPPGSLT